jgi:hypothetical protein
LGLEGNIISAVRNPKGTDPKAADLDHRFDLIHERAAKCGCGWELDARGGKKE